MVADEPLKSASSPVASAGAHTQMAVDNPAESSPVLRGFFQSLPIHDKRETAEILSVLFARLPRRGVGTAAPLRTRVSGRDARAVLEVGARMANATLDERDDEWHEWLCDREHALDRRREECARFIQHHALIWLYKPQGAMMKKGARDWCLDAQTR